VNTRVLILGAGFGGLELSTSLAEAFGGDLEVTLIDKSDAFVFGFSTLDVMFGRTTPDAVRLPYIEFGSRRVGRVDIDFLSGPTKTGSFNAPSAALVAEKEHFGSSRRARWFGT
jgi:NADH dehydrogenase FAD-containing subunit